jgi:gag-polypeptide of LTR copia-type
MKLTPEFHSKTLQRNQDPDSFITDLEALQVNMGELDHKISDKSLIIHILNNLNDQYEMEVKILEYRMQTLKEDNKEMNIEEVRTELNLRYERLKVDKTAPVDHAYYMGTRFQGKCNWCGKIGHKSNECRIRLSGKPKLEENEHGSNNNFRNNNNNNNINGNNNDFNKGKSLTCIYCHKKGHDISECRKKKREENPTSGSAHMV